MTEHQKTTSWLRAMAAVAVLVIPVVLDSCSGTPKLKGIPDKLPEIALTGSAATPSHHMASYEYPFDSAGNYVTDWAAEGERKAGRPASATQDDEEKWAAAHAKPSASKSKTGSSTKSKTTASKSGSKEDPKKKPATKSGSSSKHTVKSSDTLYSIAKKYGTTEEKLKKANGLKNDKIRDGTVLTIPK